MITPDDIYYNQGYFNSEESITFTYDVNKDFLFVKKYPKTHADIASSEQFKEIADQMFHDTDRDFLLRYDFVLGRFGSLLEGGWVIAFWNENSPDIEKTLNKLTKKFPYLNEEETLVVTFDGYMRKLSGKKIKYTLQKQDPNCDQKINVNNVPTSIEKLIGSLHSVKGIEAKSTKTQVCNQSDLVANKLANCPVKLKLLNYLVNKLDCKSDDYNKIMNNAKDAYRQELINIFRDPEKINSYFRTQRDIDRAFDYIQQKECSFKNWLIIQETLNV
jgi:hypothetical protein